ncbi:MAG TPA: hypothetical protein VFW33_12675, partial [Gemmataceae bacterium]|nr:hypothetical protein [Gemmataceae bacterium]
MSHIPRALVGGLALALLLGAVPGPEGAGAPPDTPAAVSLVADAAPGPAARHGLDKLREALRAKGLSVEDAATPRAAGGSLVIGAGLGRGAGAAAARLKALDVAPTEGAESL